MVIKASIVSQLSDAPHPYGLTAEAWNFACSGGRLPALLVNRQYNANNQSMRLPVIER
jgi:hypothetical protein